MVRTDLGGRRHRCLWGVGVVTLGLWGVWIPPEGIPPLCSLSPCEGPPAGSGIPERAGKRLRPIGASSQEGFNTWASPPRGLDKRTNLSANYFGSSSPFCPAACSGFEFTRPPPYSKLPGRFYPPSAQSPEAGRKEDLEERERRRKKRRKRMRT